MNYVLTDLTDGTNVTSHTQIRKLPTQETTKNTHVINYTTRPSLLVRIIF